jgi:AraC-like DNA-binding protein
MSVVSGNQLTLDFTPGLAERHAHILDCIRSSAYTHHNPLKTIAADMDMSQSELSRKLSGNPDDSRRFTVEDLEKFITATGDLTPIYYLVEKYLTDEDVKQRRALAELAKQLPDVLALIKAVSKGGTL